MDKFLKGVGAFVVVILVLVVLAMIGAYPVKWAINYLVNPTLLATLFTTGHFGFWHAFCLNYLAGALIKGSTSTSKEK